MDFSLLCRDGQWCPWGTVCFPTSLSLESYGSVRKEDTHRAGKAGTLSDSWGAPGSGCSTLLFASPGCLFRPLPGLFHRDICAGTLSSLRGCRVGQGPSSVRALAGAPAQPPHLCAACRLDRCSPAHVPSGRQGTLAACLPHPPALYTTDTELVCAKWKGKYQRWCVAVCVRGGDVILCQGWRCDERADRREAGLRCSG